MRLDYRELESGVRLIKLSGTLDANGVNQVDVQFVRHCTGENLCVLVDLSRVSYISSIGVPLLINSAKSLVREGGKMALLNPKKFVEDTLELMGISLIIPIYHNFDTAVSELKK
jgi:anti-sigma B factor antagonist